MSIQKKELDILLYFDLFCNQNNIKYSLDAGTLLGAVRHKGFIPWDDDIDVILSRDNYEKLLSLTDRIDKKFKLLNYNFDKEFPFTFSKLIDINTTLIEQSCSSLGYYNGIYIDIFVADKAPEDEIARKKFIKKLSFMNFLKYSYSRSTIRRGNNIIIKFLRFLILPLNKIIGLYKLNKWDDKLWKKYNQIDSNVSYGSMFFSPNLMNVNKYVEYSIFNNFIKLTFEGHEFSVVKDYDKYLTFLYGDYMELPPLEKRVSLHDFIFVDENKHWTIDELKNNNLI